MTMIGVLEDLIWDRLMKSHNCIITGCGRSGTSMLAGSLHNSGYSIGGKGHSPNEGNPKGYFETKEINGINDYLLMHDVRTKFTQGSRHGWLSLFPVDQHPFDTLNTGGLLVTHIQRLMRTRQPFVFKDPRFSYTLPIWRSHLPEDTKFICVFRHPTQVVNSILTNCKTAPYLSNIIIDEDICYEVWMCMYRHILTKHRFGGDWLFIHYDQLLHGTGLLKVEKFLCTAIDESFLDASLCRSERTDYIPSSVAVIYNELCQQADF